MQQFCFICLTGCEFNFYFLGGIGSLRIKYMLKSFFKNDILMTYWIKAKLE